MRDLIVGVDLGGTLIRAIVTDRQGRKVARCQHPMAGAGGTTGVMARLLETVREALSHVDTERIGGIGVGAPGPVDPVTGILYDPPNIPGWTPTSLTDEISAEFGLPAYAGNDANVAALGEHRFGAGRGLSDFIYNTVSTGIGGGIISGGRLVSGARGFAGEVGHQVLDPDGPVCGCGQRGHLEAFAAGPSIARDARRVAASGAETYMLKLVESANEITSEVVAKAASAGDDVALDVIRLAAFYIGLGLVNLIHLFEPARIAIGGGVSQAGDVLFEPVRNAVNENLMSHVYEGVEIVPAALEADVGLLGAVALVLSEIESLTAAER
jgi:glucokinase